MYTERAESSVFPNPRFIPDPPRGERNVGKSARGIAFGSVKRNGSRLVDDLSSSLLFFFPFFLSFSFSIPVRLLATRISTRAAFAATTTLLYFRVRLIGSPAGNVRIAEKRGEGRMGKDGCQP